MTYFDIPAERLSDLNDADLRELIARLCEAERERQGGARTDVRWGGSQTAADGGIDIVVDTTGPFTPQGPLLRPNVGIQVKAGDLSAAATKTEMRPDGALRPAISTLAEKGGAYLIASGVSASHAMLERRTIAMRGAVSDDPNASRLHLDFLDRSAIARWTSAHPSVAAWLRARLLLPTLHAWHPHGRWSATPEGVDDALIREEGLAVHLPGQQPVGDLDAALDGIRRLVREGTKAVRVAGLSGIGKTRLVQALFEPGGTDPLPASEAIYTDLGHDPDPSPMAMLTALIGRDAPATLVVDNCPPDTHQALARQLAKSRGRIRLITVEYDVRADRPEETDVVRVEAEGSGIVEALLRRRRPDLSSGDARRLAELAQGNARLGLALAQAAPETGSLSTFEDGALFDRLFWQRGERDDGLVRAAEALSLVYSFDVEGEEEPDELSFLGAFVESSRAAMHRHAATLVGRGLAQARGRWRAVLPHALANRLARDALLGVPWRQVADAFAPHPRLRRSLAGRLSYLHDATEARRIVEHWTEDGGPLAGSTPDVDVLERVCHLVPYTALTAVDGIVAGTDPQSLRYDRLHSLVRMIIRIAHDPATFPRACDSLVALAIATKDQHASNADSALEELFGLFLSGTLAQTDERVAVARQYLLLGDPTKGGYGIAMLRSALRTHHFSSAILSFDDARPDAFGWEPTGREAVEWFATWLGLAAECAASGPDAVRKNARKALADRIDGLWRRVPSLRPRLGEVAMQLHANEPWAEGRHALSQMLYFIDRRGDDHDAVDVDGARCLIERMAPTDLASRLRAVTVRGWHIEEVGGSFDKFFERRAERLHELGQELAGHPNILNALGRELLEGEGHSLQSLGIGLAASSANHDQTWSILRDAYLLNPATARQVSLLRGFLLGLDDRHPDAVANIRAECRATPALRREYGLFLPDGVLPPHELSHVIEIVAEPATAAWQISDIAWREERGLEDADRVRLLRAILGRPDGPELVVGALNMLRHVEGTAHSEWSADIRRIGREALCALLRRDREEMNDNLDHDMARVLPLCVVTHDEAATVLDAVSTRVARAYGSIYDIDETVAGLAEISPLAFLNRAFAYGPPTIDLRGGITAAPLSRIPPATLVGWCQSRLDDMWGRIAWALKPFSGRHAEAGANDLPAHATALLDAAPDPVAVLEAYAGDIDLGSFTGSRAAAIETRLLALEALRNHPRPEVRAAVRPILLRVRDLIVRIREDERREDEERDQRFE